MTKFVTYRDGNTVYVTTKKNDKKFIANNSWLDTDERTEIEGDHIYIDASFDPKIKFEIE